MNIIQKMVAPLKFPNNDKRKKMDEENDVMEKDPMSCEVCGAVCEIEYHEDDTDGHSPGYCPFCGHEIYEELATDEFGIEASEHAEFGGGVEWMDED